MDADSPYFVLSADTIATTTSERACLLIWNAAEGLLRACFGQSARGARILCISQSEVDVVALASNLVGIVVARGRHSLCHVEVSAYAGAFRVPVAHIS